MRKSYKKWGKRAAIGGIVLGAGVAGDVGMDAYEDTQFGSAVSNELPHEMNANIPDEKLRLEYQKASKLRDIYEEIAGTRRKISKLGRFILGAAPGALSMQMNDAPDFTFEQLESLGIRKGEFTPLVDLGAFDLEKLNQGELDFEKLNERGVKQIVLMEDRDPQFFLNYKGFNSDAEVPLNRHGLDTDEHPRQSWTMADMKKLIEGLHGVGIKVVIGFWGNTGDKENNAFISRNWDAVRPVIPTADDMNYLSYVKDAEGKEMPFADYILAQYSKLNADFRVDGLFLGDGFMGFRSFIDNEAPYDASSLTPLVSDFYRRVHSGVHGIDAGDTLWAYDCMGNGTDRALRNGVDLYAVAEHIDTYVFQAYGSDAWGEEYMGLEGYDVRRDKLQLASLPPALQKKTVYTVGLGDRVEGWYGTADSIKEKNTHLSAYAKQGSLGVWSTVPFENLYQE